MDAKIKFTLALGAVIVIGAGIFFVLHQNNAPQSPSAPQPAALQAPPPAAAPKADCMRPGPSPVPPNGATASAADMELAHNAIQDFVRQLEAYQACRNNQLDHAGPSVSAQQKQAWLDDGNSAVDDATGLANAFSVQLKIFKARAPKP